MGLVQAPLAYAGTQTSQNINPNIKPIIPKINPAVAFPLESSLAIPIAPKIMASIGIIINIPKNNEIIPKINANTPNVLPNCFTFIF